MTFRVGSIIRLLSLMVWGVSLLPETKSDVINLRGAGASFPNEVYQSWIPAYRALRQQYVTLYMTYDSVGSGKGKARIVAETGDLEYAGSDSLLKDSDRQGKTDLVMFPTMAGGAVLAYNLPDCDQVLNLTRDHVVGIFNGTYSHWNDSSLNEVNPSCQLPHQRILVIARRDKSGTTDMFTSALSSFSDSWRQTYGIFSTGVDDDNLDATLWNRSVIFMYGKGNNGMSGLVLSLRYSIGYMAVSAAVLVELPYARIQNRQGKFTLPTSESIQAAMDSHVSDNLTVSLADGNLEGAYPIASYTYLIIYRTQMTNCDSAKELVRYADWFMTSSTATEDCEKNKMVCLSVKVAQRIREEVLKTVTCRGQNMWDAVQSDIQNEQESQQTWVLAVAIAVPIFSLILLAMLGYILWQRYKLIRMIDSDEWNIPIEDIVFYEDKQQSGGKSRLQCMTSVKSFVSVGDIPDGPEVLSQILQWPGKWRSNVVGVRLMEVKELHHPMSRTLKKTMLWMRDSLIHANVIRFFGLTELESDRYVIGEYCAKGSMVDVLQNGKYNLNNDFKFSLAADIANGMAFLHANSIVHGLLTSSCCLIDARWTVKIGDWEYCRLLTVMFPKKSPLMMLLHRDDDQQGPHAAAFKDFWVAPEIIRAEFMQAATFPADVYSFGIILQEIYTREDPYAEHADTLTPQQVVRAVCNNHLRPQPTEDIPVRIRQIMEIAWSDNAAFRPSFEQMTKMLRQSRSNRKTVLDSMMETMEEYTHHLEEQVAERTAEVTLAKRNLETFLQDSIPQHLVSRLANGETTKLATGDTVQGKVYPHLGLVVVEVLGLQAALLHACPKEVLILLNDLCAGVDNVVRKYGAHRGAVHGETQTVLVGLESETSFLDQRCATVAHLAFDLIDFVCNMAPLASGSQTSTLALRAGINVGGVVTGIVGGAAPKFVLLGEGVDVARALAWCSETGRVRVSRNVFSHLEKNLDFVSEEAGWIVCAGMEVESFWVRLRIPRKADPVPSDHSVDSGVEVEKSRPGSGGGESVDGDQAAEDPTVEEGGAQAAACRGSENAVKDTDTCHKFLQPQQFLQTQTSQPRQQFRQQQQQLLQQPALSDITEEDERQNSPLFTQQQQLRQQYYQAVNRIPVNVLNQYPLIYDQQAVVGAYTPEYTHPINIVNRSSNRPDVIGGRSGQSNRPVYVEDESMAMVRDTWVVPDVHVTQPDRHILSGLSHPQAVRTGDDYQTGDPHSHGIQYIPVPTRPRSSLTSDLGIQAYRYVPPMPLYSADSNQHRLHPFLYKNQTSPHLPASTDMHNSSMYTVSGRVPDEFSLARNVNSAVSKHHSGRPSPDAGSLSTALPSVSIEMEDTPQKGQPEKSRALKSPSHSLSPVASTSFSDTPPFPRVLSPRSLESAQDVEVEKTDLAGVREGQGVKTAPKASEQSKTSKVSSYSTEISVVNGGSLGESSKTGDDGPAFVREDDASLGQDLPKSKASGKGKTKKNNKVYPNFAKMKLRQR